MYSEQAGLQSFIGQYAELFMDIYDALRGYEQEGQLKLVSARDRETRSDHPVGSIRAHAMKNRCRYLYGNRFWYILMKTLMNNRQEMGA